MSPRVLPLTVITLAVSLPLAASAQHAGPPEKILLEYGWDVPKPSFVAEHIREMEQRPFDGLLMRISPLGQIFRPVRHELPPEEEAALRAIDWDRFTDNFLMMYAASEMDWFSDEDWEIVLENVALVARAAAIGRCKGVCFDAEPYGDNPWHYPSQPHADEYTFDQFQAKVRQRGAQFIDAIEAEMDDPVVHTFFLTTVGGLKDAAQARTEQEADEILRDYHYGLYGAFINGMLDAIDPGTLLNDGNEPAYYYHDRAQYYDVYHYMKQTALGAIARENWPKYRQHVLASQALYVDQIFGLRPRVVEGHYMSPEERRQWFEHNVYWSLKTSDRYVWLYSERMNWWTDTDIPPGLEEAVVAARRKLEADEPMTIDADAIWRRARERMQAEQQANLLRREATIRRIPARMAPTIDGHRDDEAWSYATELEPVVGTMAMQGEVEATTIVHVTYDDSALYIAVRCMEPKMNELEIVGSNRDDSIWLGDSVDVFLQREEGDPYHHLIVNPANVRWDAKHVDVDADTSWNTDWQSATLTGDGFWNLEIALPWSALGWQTPTRGSTIRANICRQR